MPHGLLDLLVGQGDEQTWRRKVKETENLSNG